MMHWHKASEVFKKHEKSSSHKDAIYKWSQIVSSTTVLDQVNYQKASDRQLATKCLVEIFTTIQFLARQGIALRGHEELQSNFHQLLLLRTRENPELRNWLDRKTIWTSHDIQNEILPLM